MFRLFIEFPECTKRSLLTTWKTAMHMIKIFNFQQFRVFVWRCCLAVLNQSYQKSKKKKNIHLCMHTPTRHRKYRIFFHHFRSLHEAGTEQKKSEQPNKIAKNFKKILIKLSVIHCGFSSFFVDLFRK